MPQVYRQIAHRLRVQRGPGRPDLVSERPRHKDSGRVLDSDEKPTLISFDEYCLIDLDGLVRLGAIAIYAPPAPHGKPVDRKETG